jgi:hypothetical protein
VRRLIRGSRAASARVRVLSLLRHDVRGMEARARRRARDPGDELRDERLE